jgi:L,D-peptidoglycan transpeptidase YkuD (ErfK/YbiS/YcfS/YnhG family)
MPPEDVVDDGSDPRAPLPYPLKHVGAARQVVIATTRSWTGTLASLEAFEQGPGGWSRALEPTTARIGRLGLIPASRRRQGSGTTPAGTFGLTTAFGLAPDPGSRLPYTHVTCEDTWWVGDPTSRHYNTPRSAEQGGFRRIEHGRHASERIAAHPVEYRHAVVIDFNRPNPVHSRGSGIFLRGGVGHATDGGLALEPDELVRLLRWLDPASQPVIVIAPERVIADF